MFADYARNMRASTPAAFDLIRNSLKPQTSDTVEGGLRFHDGSVPASLSGFYVNLQNRLNAETVGTAIQGGPATLANVGSSAEGAGVAGHWNIWRSFLFNRTYSATIGENGFVDSDPTGTFPTGTFATMLAGPPFEAFMTV